MTLELKQYFSEFLEAIRPTASQRADAKAAHLRLRERLAKDAPLDEHVITTFLQGSYRRSTDVRPVGDKKSDVDIVVVTNMSEQRFSPSAALDEFRAFLQQYYAGQYEMQDRSWGVVDGEVELDLVPTSAPSEAVAESFRELRKAGAAVDLGLEESAVVLGILREAAERGRRVTAALATSDEWRDDPLHIPDRKREKWQPTHPLLQIDRTIEKNAACEGHFVNVVRCVKWWHLEKAGDVHPRGYPLEAIVFRKCPTGLDSVAEGFVRTLEAIRNDYKATFDKGDQKPQIWDHGVRTQDVLARLSIAEFRAFYECVALWAPFARRALDETDREVCIERWRQIFGGSFPGPEDGGGGGGTRVFPTPTSPVPAVPVKRYA